ncbi:MAG: DMT family transporter [Solirubrobacterales bacterium]|nr:DMT family transporter [Solirubrobacterales bacterium]
MGSAAAPPSAAATLAARPRAMATIGAFTIAFSAILVRAAEVTPSTAAIFRCAYAVPVLWWLARREDRAYGARPRHDRRLAAIAGLFFAADLITWHHAIEDVGAGLATVLANVQVVLVPLAAWLALRERADRRVVMILPLVMAGIVLISGVLEYGAYGDHPLRGAVFGLLTGISYAGFILVLRHGSSDLRRPAGPLFDATWVAALAALAAGVALGEADLAPSWPAHGYLVLLALTSQVVGWLLISASLPRLPAAMASLLLTVQPLGSVVLAMLIFGESPTTLQLGGAALVLAGLVLVTRRRPAPAG